MKKRKGLAVVIGCVSLLGLCLTGCGSNVNSEKGGIERQTESGTEEKKEEKTIKMDDLDWSVDEGVVDGDRYVLLELTNNSPYTLSSFEITFKEKKDITTEDKEKFYSDVQTKFEFSEEDMKELREKEISMHADTDRVVNPGESIKNVNCYYFGGSYYLKSMEHYNLVEPDIATIKYIDNEKIYTVYYDFSSNKYSSEEKTDVAYQWTETDLGNKVPKPDVKVLEAGRDDKMIFMFDAYGLSLDQFNSYVSECKNLGYTVDESSFEGFYSADNEEGYNVYLYYSEDDESMSGTIKSPEE